MEEEQCPCDDCDDTCDYWDSKYWSIFINMLPNLNILENFLPLYMLFL